MAFISVHIDDLLVVGTKEYVMKFHSRLPKELKLKIEGPLQCGDDGSIFYFKRELQFVETGICLAPSSRYIPNLAEILKIYDRRGKTLPHHGSFQIYDVETTSSEEHLGSEESKPSDQHGGFASMWARRDATSNTLCVFWQPTWRDLPKDFNERNQEACELADSHQGHEDVLQQGGVEADSNAKMVWWTSQDWNQTLHVGTFQWQRLGVTQSEQEKHKFRTHFFEWMFGPQPLKIPDVSVFEFNGGWNPCSHKLVDRNNLRETSVAIPGEGHARPWKPTMRGDEIEIGFYERTSFLHEAWTTESKTFVNKVAMLQKAVQQEWHAQTEGVCK